jgi:hypothetical protein
MSDPREVEATASTNTVEFRGETFTVPLERSDWSVDMVESLEEGKAVGTVRGALGPDQWRTVRAMNLKVRDLAELSDLIARAMGFGDSGESTASSA